MRHGEDLFTGNSFSYYGGKKRKKQKTNPACPFPINTSLLQLFEKQAPLL
jgi:hypothetical protein